MPTGYRSLINRFRFIGDHLTRIYTDNFSVSFTFLHAPRELLKLNSWGLGRMNIILSHSNLLLNSREFPSVSLTMQIPLPSLNPVSIESAILSRLSLSLPDTILSINILTSPASKLVRLTPGSIGGFNRNSSIEKSHF